VTWLRSTRTPTPALTLALPKARPLAKRRKMNDAEKFWRHVGNVGDRNPVCSRVGMEAFA